MAEECCARVRVSCCCGVVLAGTSPTTHPQALSVPLGTACCASPYTLLVADLAQCCCDDQGRSLFHHHLDLRRSTCAPLCCSHVSRQVATRNCFRFLLLHGRWAACDRCDRGPRTPPVSTRNVHKLCVAVLQVYGIRRTANLIVGMFVAEVACRRTVDV